MTQWSWRKGPPRDPSPYFHAHDPNTYRGACGYDSEWEVGPSHLICIEEPNEGSLLCPDCLKAVSTHRAYGPQGSTASVTSVLDAETVSAAKRAATWRSR